MDFGTEILGAMGSILGLLVSAIVVGLIPWCKARRNQLTRETVLKLAEKGQPAPSSCSPSKPVLSPACEPASRFLCLGLASARCFFIWHQVSGGRHQPDVYGVWLPDRLKT